jgi:glycosyltransferase involved in cell wall biosynthesis
MKTPSLWQLGMHFDPSGGGADRCFDNLLRGLEANGSAFTAAAFDAKAVSPVAEHGKPACQRFVPEGKSSVWPGRQPERCGATCFVNEVSGFDGDAADDEIFRRISLGPSRGAIWKRRAALRRFGAKIASAPPPKVLASHFSLYAFFLLPFLQGTKHVVHFHGPWADEAAAAGAGKLAVFFKRHIERAVYSRADRMITLSQAFRLLLIENFGVRPEKIFVVPGSVDTENFRPTNGRDALRRRLGWPTDRRILFCVRRLVARMGLAELIDSFAKIAARLPDVDLHIGGRGKLESDLRARALRLGLERRIVFCGFIPEDDLPGHYAASDLSILPSQKLEGFGLAAVESLACGVPVLVTPVGGLPEVVEGLGRNLILDGADPDAIARGLMRAFAAPGYLPPAGDCRAFAEKNYSIRGMAQRCAEIYGEVTSR